MVFLVNLSISFDINFTSQRRWVSQVYFAFVVSDVVTVPFNQHSELPGGGVHKGPE